MSYENFLNTAIILNHLQTCPNKLVVKRKHCIKKSSYSVEAWA